MMFTAKMTFLLGTVTDFLCLNCFLIFVLRTADVSFADAKFSAVSLCIICFGCVLADVDVKSVYVVVAHLLMIFYIHLEY